MNVREIQAKTLLSSTTHPDPWFGIKYTMNLYRGCAHRCIYCDSRSECYQIEHFDDEILVKINAPALLRQELAHKRIKGYVGTGSMNDPYQAIERQYRLTAQALAIIAQFGFPVHILTKSDLILRDTDLLLEIKMGSGPEGAVASFTVTAADDDLARKLEPGAPPTSARFRALETLAAAGIRTGIMLMPILPYLEDNAANITAIVTRAHDSGASHVVPGFGMTLRDRQRAYYYAALDRLFPGLRPVYERRFGERYHAAAQNEARLEALFDELAARYGLARGVAPYHPQPVQLALF